MDHPQFEEAFLRQPSKMKEVLLMLEQMATANKMEDNKKERKTSLEIGLVDDTSFIVSRRSSKRISKRFLKVKSTVNKNMEQFTFMRQIDEDLPERTQARIEREDVAQNFRRLGNDEYRHNNYDNAIMYYNKGLEYIKDTPVLYANRALCYIKQRNYKLAIMDCDYVINKLDPRCLRAWLYRAGAFKRSGDEKAFEESVYQARKLNSKEKEFIDNFLEKMRTDL
ncbi:tetratricopeptide repeat protein 12 [Scaptodrosophila lebanonensis]|uniref:Tetratricopeptide repeat protein 12 n=1 Tax=Drosophila lebanonensis TaxID=7225 RepID=A0A6J2TF97_DROLE|nr:tetratricopeptide repeat protein 12 [Scaptodrosophila lebanonensis]